MMSYKDVSLLALRLTLGWMMFYAGITKVINPEWSAAGFLMNANTFGDLYAALASPALLPFVNLANEWGLTLIGIALIAGALVRISALLGAVMMVLYYFPALTFPYVGEHSFIVDDHIIYVAGFLVLAAFNAGTVYGFDGWRRMRGR